MQAKTRRKLAMAVRVLEFFKAHPCDQASYREAIRELEDCLSRANALVARREAVALRIEAVTLRREEVSRSIRRDLHPRVARASRALAASRPDLAEVFRTARGGTDRGFLIAARILAQADQLSVDPVILTDLGQAAAELSAILDTIDELHAAAQREAGELAKVVLEMSRLIGQLDGLNRHRFRTDSALQEAWASARNLAGPYRPRPVGSSDGRTRHEAPAA